VGPTPTSNRQRVLKGGCGALARSVGDCETSDCGGQPQRHPRTLDRIPPHRRAAADSSHELRGVAGCAGRESWLRVAREDSACAASAPAMVAGEGLVGRLLISNNAPTYARRVVMRIGAVALLRVHVSRGETLLMVLPAGALPRDEPLHSNAQRPRCFRFEREHLTHACDLPRT
jgi:hypothetical protein